jgi:chemotaxis protein methyltransferase CheR
VGRILTEHRALEHQLSEKEFKFICKLVHDTTGIVLDERKREMVYRRLMRRTRELKIVSFSAYCQFLSDRKDEELPNFVNAITTNLTSFFREQHHFSYLKDVFFPAHQQKFSAQRRLRIWSAACSTGEEPYSLAITLKQALGADLDHWDARILATDLDTNVLSTAKGGVYHVDRIKGLPESVCKRWFMRGVGDNSNCVKVDPDLSRLIVFKQLNLLEDWPVRGPFDVIMCRNVLIYFDKPTQQQLVQRFCELLRPQGLLILGHSESIAKQFSYFEARGHTIFEKIN